MTHAPRLAFRCWALLAPFLLAACSGGDVRGPRQRPNVLLIVIDTLGAEYLGCQTPGLATSPAIDALASEGARFSGARTTAPWTQPAVGSLFTSLWPSDHGVRRIFDALPGQHSTLAERFADAGWKTSGVISHFIIDRPFGYDQGFQHWDATSVAGHRAVTSGAVADAAIRSLDELRNEPFFLFVHFFDPHWYYNHHAEYDLTSGYRGQLAPGMEIGTLRALRDRMAPEDIAYLENLYREEIAFTDAHVGRLLAHLRGLGLDEDTLVILTADHGEEFMRHGWIGHTATLYEELMHVPLIVRWPGRIAPRVIDTPVSILDVMPTVLDLLGLEPDPVWQGISLRNALLSENVEPPARPLFSEVSYVSPEGWPSGDGSVKTYFKTAILDGRRKLVHDLQSGLWELYDLDDDPHEQRNAFDPEDDEAGSLQSLLRAWESGRVGSWGLDLPGGIEMDPAEIERLRSLGYVH